MLLRIHGLGAAAAPLLLLLACTTTLTKAQNCVVSVNGIDVTEFEWTFGYAVPDVSDTTAPGSKIVTFDTTNVNGAVLSEGQDYLLLDNTSPGIVDVILDDNFADYEKFENNLDFTRGIDFTCQDSQTRTLPVRVELAFTNNHAPVLENQNNVALDGYEFELPMPFPRGVSITAAYNEIMAYDVDINQVVVIPNFSLEGAGSELFVVAVGRQEIGDDQTPPKTRYFANLQAKEQLRLTSGLTFDLIVTDQDGDTPQATRASITITVDDVNSDPLPSSFSSLQYVAPVTDTNMDPGPLTTGEKIMILDPPPIDVNPITIAVVAAPGTGSFYDGLFTAVYGPNNDGEVIFNLARKFDPANGEIDHEVLSVMLQATQLNNGVFLAETLVQVNLPAVAGPLPATFSSPLYTAVVLEGALPSVLPVLPDPMQMTGYDGDDVDVALAGPLEGAGPFYQDFFSVTYNAGGIVTFRLELALTPEVLLNERLVMAVKATKQGTTDLLAETLIQVDIPQEGAPTTPARFSSSLYTAAVLEPESPPATELPTLPGDIQLLDYTGDDVNVALSAAPAAPGEFYDGLFTVAYDAGSVTLTLARALSKEELMNEKLVMVLRATQQGTNELLAETLLQVDIPVVAAASFSSELYYVVIDEPEADPNVPLVPISPGVIQLTDYSGDDVTVSVESPPDGSPFIADQFVAVYHPGGNVDLMLKTELMESALRQDTLVLLLRATQDISGDEIATTMVNVDIPQNEVFPAFISTLHWAAISDLAAVGDQATTPAIQMQDYPAGDIAVRVLPPPIAGLPDYSTYFAARYSNNGLFVLQYTSSMPEDVFQNEGIYLTLRASQIDVFAVDTLIHIDMVAPPDSVFGDFGRPLYAATLITEQPIGTIATTEEIRIIDPPTGNIIVRVLAPPGLGNPSFETYFEAEHMSDGLVELRLGKALDTDPLNSEVIVVVLEARAEDDPGYVSTTVVHMDVPPIVLPPPGDPGTFTSVIYVTEVTGPEMAPGVLSTDLPIEITEPPAGTITVELSPASQEIGSFVEHFTVQYAAGIVTLELATSLPEEAFNNPALAMKLRATSSDDPDYLGETVIHVQLPEKTCIDPEPSTCAPWPTCPPCTTTTQPPPTSIEHIGGPYISTMEAGEVNGLLFTVKAQLLNGAIGTIEYGFDTQGNAALDATLTMPDKSNGELFLSAELAPGHYTFRVSALHVEGGAFNTAWENAILNVRSVAECDDGSSWFRYSLITREILEATEIIDLLPGDNPPTNPDCQFNIYEAVPEEAREWFIYDADTGRLSATAETDAEAAIFSDSDNPQVRLTLQVVCDESSAQPVAPKIEEESIVVTRQQMLMIVSLANVNEHPPEFAQTRYAVAYPEEILARQILPGAIAVLHATDSDLGDSVRYTLAENNERFSIHEQTGSLYPVQGLYNYRDTTVRVRAWDQNNDNQADTSVEIRHVNDGEIAVLMVANSALEDVEELMESLNSQLEHIWGVLRAAVVARDATLRELSPAMRSRLERKLRAGTNAGLFLIVYALDESNYKPQPFSEIKRQLNSLSNPDFMSVETWDEAGRGSSFDGVNASLEAAVIALGIITGLLVIALVIILYLLIFRKRQQKKMAAKLGFKNRTSFSNPRDSVSAAEKGSRTEIKGPAPPPPPPGNWLTPDDLQDDESRRKSIVTFSDQPEVIPSETARL